MDGKTLSYQICATLKAKGYQAYLVGGCVRDIILCREPADYDVATDATPDIVQQIFPRSLAVGVQFGVIVVLDVSAEENPVQVDVATFRSDIGSADGRHPDRVAYTKSPEEDVRRRDFTINGLLLDPETNQVVDFVGGRKDIEVGIIRAIGDPVRRFTEDKLRMLRGVRFAARFDYKLDPQTRQAYGSLAAQVTKVSAERIRDELTKILIEGAARRGFELLDEAGLLIHLLPEVSRMKGVPQPPQYHPEGDVWIHTLLMLEKLPPGCPETQAWGVLLHDVGKPTTFAPPEITGDRIRFNEHAEIGMRIAEDICHRLRFSNEETEQIAALVANHMKFKDVINMKPATLKRFIRLERFDEHLELHRLDCLSSHGSLDNYDYTRRFIEETPAEQVRPARLLTGDDLKAMGFAPGPAFREILEAIENAQLDGRIADHESAVRLVEEEFAGLKNN
ncbi:MAG TPA: CCA tRNA nucleotidyltransferase [Candidatus Aquilonibacter sp.]|nr:CCA tRNA nucleotidyltransferase [Candidatus Aquilonibacter sp.]